MPCVCFVCVFLPAAMVVELVATTTHAADEAVQASVEQEPDEAAPTAETGKYLVYMCHP